VSDPRPPLPASSTAGQPPTAPQPAPPGGLPPFSRVLPLLAAAVLLLALFLFLVRWVLGPGDFTQRVISFSIAAALTMWLIYVLDGAQRRTIERIQARMQLERDRDIARALAAEREQRLKDFMGSFVISVHGSAGEFVPYPAMPLPYGFQSPAYGEGVPRAISSADPRPERPAGSARAR
jgi:hypothetical protein